MDRGDALKSKPLFQVTENSLTNENVPQISLQKLAETKMTDAGGNISGDSKLPVAPGKKGNGEKSVLLKKSVTSSKIKNKPPTAARKSKKKVEVILDDEEVAIMTIADDKKKRKLQNKDNHEQNLVTTSSIPKEAIPVRSGESLTSPTKNSSKLDMSEYLQEVQPLTMDVTEDVCSSTMTPSDTRKKGKTAAKGNICAVKERETRSKTPKRMQTRSQTIASKEIKNKAASVAGKNKGSAKVSKQVKPSNLKKKEPMKTNAKRRLIMKDSPKKKTRKDTSSKKKPIPAKPKKSTKK